MKTSYGANLEKLYVGSIIGLLIDDESKLHLYINGIDQGVAVTDVPSFAYAVIDLYGQCEEVAIVNITPFVNTALDNSNCDVENNATAVMVERLPIDPLEDIENSREKADLECHEKENASPPPIPEDMPIIVQIQDNSHLLLQVSHSQHQRDNFYDKSTNSDQNLCSSDVDNDFGDKPESNQEVDDQEVECTNVEINNATNINIKNGTAINASHMSALSSAITSSNANNAINECIASNSQNNNSSNNNSNNNPFLSGSHIVNNEENVLTNAIIPAQNLISNAIFNHGGSVATTPLGIAEECLSKKKCEYLKACTRLKKSLVLPDEFFSHDEVVCYCDSCYKVDGDSLICKKGEPLAEYVIPVGWVRFPLKHSINTNQIAQSTTDKWHVAFYGSRLDAVR